MVATTEILERPTEEGSADSGFAAFPLRGRMARWLLLAANAAVVIVCSIAPTILMHQRALFAPLPMFLTQMIPGVILMGPFMLVTLVAAWGPHRFWVRGVWLITYAVMTALPMVLAGWVVMGCREPVGDIVWLAMWSTVTQIVFLVPSVLGLVMLGSWRGIRLGPTSLQRIKVSIGAIMIATAAIGILVAIKAGLDQVSVPTGRRTQRDFLGESMIEVLLIASLASVAAFTSGVASRNWAARMVSVLLTIAVAFAVVFASGASSRLGLTDAELVTIVGGTMAIPQLWVTGCVFILHRSGWELSRR